MKRAPAGKVGLARGAAKLPGLSPRINPAANLKRDASRLDKVVVKVRALPYPLPPPSPFLLVGFCVITLATCLALFWGLVRFSADRGSLLRLPLRLFLGWVLLTGALATTGALAPMGPPPAVIIPIAFAFIATVILAFLPSVKAACDRVPLWFFIGISVFRLPLELLMHRAAEEGIMPPQMSYSGSNYDIVTGALALPVAFLAYRRLLPRLGMRLFNIIGATLLFNIVAIAVFSMPAPWRHYLNDPPNVWITQFPFVWLPTVLVPIALFSHLQLFRRVANTSL